MRDVVATPVQLSGPPRRSRTVDERLMVRFPGAWRALARLVTRLLSPRSRLRRALLVRNVISGWAAASRRDWELVLVRYARDVEIEFVPEFEALGLGGTFRGHDGMVEMFQAFGEAWEQWDVTPVVGLDLGDAALVLGTVRLPGTASGLELTSEVAQLSISAGGLLAHEQNFLSWDDGLRAAGLDPDTIDLPSSERVGQATTSAGSGASRERLLGWPYCGAMSQ